MRELHVIGVSDDGNHLLLAADVHARRPTHRLPADDRVRAALRGDLAAQSARAESALTPREIQARLRAGETPEQVAKAAGVPVARVLRYAGPVLSEQERTVEEARAAVMARPRRGVSAAPLGTAVDARLAGKAGVRPDTVRWGARRTDDGCWVVDVSFTLRGRPRQAQWRWDHGHRTVTPIDAVAADLGYVAEPQVSGTPPRPTARGAVRRPARTAAGTHGGPGDADVELHRTRRAPARGQARQPAASSPGRTPRPAAAAARRTAAGAAGAAGAPRPARRAAAAGSGAARSGAAATRASGGAGATARSRDAAAKRSRAVPATREEVPGPRPADHEERRGRKAVPSWSEVLLTVRPGEAAPQGTRRGGPPSRRAARSG